MKKRNAGFTLIEMAVVLVILSMAAAGGLAIVARSTDVEKVRITRERMEKVLRAVEIYVMRWGYVPCPANPMLSPTNEYYSKQMCYISGGTQYANATMIPISHAATKVSMGAVPTGALGLSPDYMLDGWGRQFSFVMDRDVPLTASLPFGYTGNTDIRVVDAAGVPMTKDGAGLPTTSANDDPRNPAVVIISHGKNGFGAFPYKSISLQNKINDSRAAANRTMENDNAHCDTAPGVACTSASFDNIFRVLTPREVEGSAPGTTATDQFFDDIVMWRTLADLKNATNN